MMEVKKINIFDLLNKIYSKDGFSFKKSMKVPLIGYDMEASIFVLCKNPTEISLTYANSCGRIEFTKNAPSVKIPRFLIETSLTAIDFTEKSAILRMRGFTDLEYLF